jgi:HEPN domain-containing protein
MDRDVEVWLGQGLYDFESARITFDNERYSTSAFLVQQSVEKCLKALFLFENEGLVPQSHSLIYLSSSTSIPNSFKPFLRVLTPKFVDTRYPDASIGAPYELYGKEDVSELLHKAQEVIGWIQKKIRG